MHSREALAQHPAADLGDQAGFLGNRDEERGRNRAEFRMVPARQRFAGDDAARLEVDQRLERQRQAIGGHAGLELGLEPLAIAVLGVHLVVEHLALRLAARLGLVEREVGLGHQCVERVFGIGADHHAEADVDRRGSRPTISNGVIKASRTRCRIGLRAVSSDVAAADRRRTRRRRSGPEWLRRPSARDSRSATSTSSRSPTRWPSVSLTCLKSSRSTITSMPEFAALD